MKHEFKSGGRSRGLDAFHSPLPDFGSYPSDGARAKANGRGKSLVSNHFVKAGLRETGEGFDFRQTEEAQIIQIARVGIGTFRGNILRLGQFLWDALPGRVRGDRFPTP
jgi:hypothetical protein